MKIAYQHILRLLQEKPSIEELSKKLFQLGHEHEINGSIFDMEFTPNRGDCLSLLGVSRDLNVFYKTDLNLPIYTDKLNYTDKLKSLNLNFVNYEKDICPEISFLNIEIKGPVKKYKHYLQSYFDDLNLNKNNFYTDISNYIGYEMGQPTHCYDSQFLNGDISLKKNTPFNQIETIIKNYKRQFRNKNDRIIVQDYINKVDSSGVIFTKDNNTEAPYYLINFDLSGQTDLVTSGKKNDHHNQFICYKNFKVKNKFSK